MNLRNSKIVLNAPPEDLSKFGESANFSSQNVFSDTVGNNEVSLNTRTHEEYSVPTPVYLQLSTLFTHLSVAFKKDIYESFDFYLKDIIVEYMKGGWAKEYLYQNNRYYSTYCSGHISVGIPTERYNWFLKQLEKLSPYKVDRNSLTETNGYTWIIAANKYRTEFCTYSKKSDQLVLAGYLYDTLQTLESNVVGTGLFHISIVESTIDHKHFLKFELKKFQLNDKTDISSTIKETVDKTEPPEALLAKLNIRI